MVFALLKCLVEFPEFWIRFFFVALTQDISQQANGTIVFINNELKMKQTQTENDFGFKLNNYSERSEKL